MEVLPQTTPYSRKISLLKHVDDYGNNLYLILYSLGLVLHNNLP